MVAPGSIPPPVHGPRWLLILDDLHVPGPLQKFPRIHIPVAEIPIGGRDDLPQHGNLAFLPPFVLKTWKRKGIIMMSDTPGRNLEPSPSIGFLTGESP